MPQRTRSLFESFVPQDGLFCWPYAPSLTHVDQRQLALEWKRDEQLQHRASKADPFVARELFLQRVVDRKVQRK